MTYVSYRECRVAVRRAREAECGRQALRAARGGGAFVGLLGAGPIAVALYVASREGRLVWQTPDGFAIIEPPIPERSPLFGGGSRLTACRILDRHWSLVVLVVPCLLSWVLAIALVLVSRGLLLVALSLIVLGLCYLVLLMFIGLLDSGRWLYRLGRSVDTASMVAGSDWHVRLCHQRNETRSEELLRQTAAQLNRVVAARVRLATAGRGVRVPDVIVTRSLAFLMPRITTGAMRTAVSTAAGVIRPFGQEGDVVMMLLPESAPAERRTWDRGGVAFWYLFALAIGLVGTAEFVPDWERQACQGAACVDRPTTFALAFRWALGRLLPFLGGPDIVPATTRTWILGWLISISGVMAVVVIYLGGRDFRRAMHQRRTDLEKSMESIVSGSRILILVVKQLERDAVLAAVRSINGMPTRSEAHGSHTVFNVGVLGGANILVAQSSMQGMAGPNGMMLTAASLIQSCRPDYLILTGICYGLWEEDLSVGDVIVSQRVYDIDHRKVIDVDQAQVVQYRGERVSSSGVLLDRFNAATESWNKPCRIEFGTMLSSNTVVDSPALRAVLKNDHPDAAGGEMEGAAVFAAAAKSQVDWIVVKGVSDFAMNKIDTRQGEAARNAAEFIAHTIMRGDLRDRPVT